MDILTFVRTKLEDSNFAELGNVSSITKVPLETIKKIKYGTTDNPRIKTIQPLLDYFEGKKFSYANQCVVQVETKGKLKADPRDKK